MILSTAREPLVVAGAAILALLLLVLAIATIRASLSARSSGIGVSLARVQASFEDPLFGFTVTAADTVDRRRLIVRMAPAQGFGELQLVGTKRHLTRAAITVRVSRHNQDETARSAIYLNGFIMVAAPDWKEGPAWVTDNLARALSAGTVVTTLTNPLRTVSMSVEAQVGSVLLSIGAGS